MSPANRVRRFRAGTRGVVQETLRQARSPLLGYRTVALRRFDQAHRTSRRRCLTMMPQTIDIIVSPQAAATVTTKGFARATCRDASKFREQALGQVANQRLTAEFHAAPVQGRVQTNQG